MLLSLSLQVKKIIDEDDTLPTILRSNSYMAFLPNDNALNAYEGVKDSRLISYHICESPARKHYFVLSLVVSRTYFFPHCFLLSDPRSFKRVSKCFSEKRELIPSASSLCLFCEQYFLGESLIIFFVCHRRKFSRYTIY